MFAFVVLGLVFSCQAKRLAVGMAPKWPISCRVGIYTGCYSCHNPFNLSCLGICVVLRWIAYSVAWFFSEFERTFTKFTFTIWYRPSVCRLSSVCNSRAAYSGAYSGGSNFRQYFYGIRYLGHPLTSTENFMEIIPGEPLRRGVKHKRGSPA